ncbi:MAG: hypothetical protein R3C14_25000 [Caldilineaceae bacterium]
MSFSPSMPIVDIRVINIEQPPMSVALTAMIDSGADGTMVPLFQLRAIQARRSGQIIMRTVTGIRSLVDIYTVALQIGPHTFPHVRVAADRQNDMIVLGRDVLNHLIVTLNGLASATEIQE